MLRMSLICCTLPFRSLLPSVRAPSESEGSTREWIGARPIGDRFRSSLAKVEWTRHGRARGKDGMMPIWTETATERTVLLLLLQGKYAALSP